MQGVFQHTFEKAYLIPKPEKLLSGQQLIHVPGKKKKKKTEIKSTFIKTFSISIIILKI